MAPKANTKLTIRGDALHGTSGANVSLPGVPSPVLSLILEQYKVPTALYSQTQEFRVEPFHTEFRAKRPDLKFYRPFTEEQKAAAALASQSLPGAPAAGSLTIDSTNSTSGSATYSTDSRWATVACLFFQI